jgi:deferrochelatase/peroxidase EfeB
VVLTPDHDDVSIAHANGFGYLSDLAGLGCPVGAHIRRANPRDSLHRIDDTAAESLTAVSQHRILRRGIRYGSDLYDLSSIDDGYAPFGLVDDGKERGLHFVALNSDNQRQFEFIQQSWLDKPSFNGIFPAKDPVVGDNDGTGTATVPATPLRWRIGGVPRFVSVRGGAYWFLPSRRSLRYLAGLGR